MQRAFLAIEDTLRLLGIYTINPWKNIKTQSRSMPSLPQGPYSANPQPQSARHVRQRPA
jgi:hypothetical protein